jgi:hypothetical protein
MQYEKPKRISDEQVKADFYHRAKEEEFEVYVEYYATAPYIEDPEGLFSSRGHKMRSCRFDAVIVDDGEIVAIIECKGEPRDLPAWVTPRTPSASKQMRRYGSYGVPVLRIAGQTQIEKAISMIKDILRLRGSR